MEMPLQIVVPSQISSVLVIEGVWYTMNHVQLLHDDYNTIIRSSSIEKRYVSILITDYIILSRSLCHVGVLLLTINPFDINQIMRHRCAIGD